MRRVAYLTGASWRGGPLQLGELPGPDAEDYKLLEPAARAAGIAFEIRRWDDPDLAEAGFDGALIRSTWDYAQRAAAFRARLAEVEAQGLRLFNPSAVVAWNARKTYLQELAAQDVPTIPTVWTERVTPHDVIRAFDTFEAAELVVKPQVGAGSQATIRIRRNAWSEADLIAAPTGPAMLQPFLPSIQTAGETSIFLFGGAVAHTIHKLPAEGKWFANVDGARFGPGVASAAQMEAARAAVAASPRGMLYARVDLVEGQDGAPRVIEVEAIEPYLFLTFAPPAAAALARALVAALDAPPA
ncbi:MAG: transporter [Alphaproteobacteria bacterium]|nr:transporter [Alphaproteobacteria bacterium]